MRTYKFRDGGSGVDFIEGDSKGFIPPGGVGWDEYQAWIAEGFTPAPAHTFAEYKELKLQEVREACNKIILAKWPYWMQFNALAAPANYPAYIPEMESVRAESNRVELLISNVTEAQGFAGIDAAAEQVNWPNIGVFTHA